MLLNADEVGRSLVGSWRLLQRRPDGIQLFDASWDGFWRSFGAILLTPPAVVVALAAERARIGLGTDGAWFGNDIGLTLLVTAACVVVFYAFPVLLAGVARRLGLTHGFVPFVVAHNWTSAFLAYVFAVPAGLFALDLATPALAAFYGIAFLALAGTLRWSLARAAFGVSAGVAAVLAAADLGIALLLFGLFGVLIG